MNLASTEPEGPVFASGLRLRGEVGGADRTFGLRSGANVVGRGPASDVALPVKGVSQRHALLTLGPGGLRLEDLGSKNGSFVNGSRVTTAELSPGDEIWFGGTELTVERIDDLEMRLAVELTPAPDALAADALAEATPTRRNWLDSRLVRRWFTALGALLRPAEEGEGLESALGRVVSLVGARAAAILDLGGSDAVVLAACGEIEEALGGRLTAWLATTDPAASRYATLVAPGREPLTVAVRTDPAQRPLAVVLCGDFNARAESEPLLTTLLALVRDRHLPAAAPPAADADAGGPGLRFPPGYVPGVSAAIEKLHAQMAPLAGSDLPVLVSGETGVGKEWVARILHLSSERRRGPFVAINCAAVPADLLEAELFGIGKGVATGVSERPGRFLQAQGGTLLLDEIGDLPEVLQPKLLRALEEREIHPVGERPVAIDVRIVAATNSDLDALLAGRRFRADLYYRLAGAGLRIPPLRQRRDDVPMLVEYFLRRISEEVGKPIRGITVKALRYLMSYHWPGNVRELVHEVRRLVYVCPEGEAIESSLLAEPIRRARETGGGARRAAPAAPPGGAREPAPPIEEWLTRAESLDLRTIECAVLAEALRRTGGNQVQAGKLLGLSRMAVRRRIDRCRDLGEPRG